MDRPKRRTLSEQKADAAIRAAGPGASYEIQLAYALAPTLAAELAGLCSRHLLEHLNRVVTAPTPPGQPLPLDPAVFRELEGDHQRADRISGLEVLIVFALLVVLGIAAAIVPRDAGPWVLFVGLALVFAAHATYAVKLSTHALAKEPTGQLAARMAYGVHLRALATAATWRAMTWSDFEKNVADLFRRLGHRVEVTAGAGDKGIDLVVEMEGVRTVVQCKKQLKPIGPAVVRELRGAVTTSPGAVRAIIVSCSGFSTGAIEAGKETGVNLWALEDLIRIGRTG
jgi:hypothetical protein